MTANEKSELIQKVVDALELLRCVRPLESALSQQLADHDSMRKESRITVRLDSRRDRELWNIRRYELLREAASMTPKPLPIHVCQQYFVTRDGRYVSVTTIDLPADSEVVDAFVAICRKISSTEVPELPGTVDFMLEDGYKGLSDAIKSEVVTATSVMGPGGGE